jgi:cleavage and polyadenylation specificity factor subunit 4
MTEATKSYTAEVIVDRPSRSKSRTPTRKSSGYHLSVLVDCILVMATILSRGPGAKDLSRQILEHQAPKYTFAFTPFLFQTYRHGLSPNRPTCKAYLQGHCPLGSACPDKHTSANSNSNFNNLVCKHWLRGLCKKGESCEFLHEFNLRKMPECNFFVRNGYCSNGGKSVLLSQYPHANDI